MAKKRRKKKQSIVDQLRAAIVESGLSQNEIERRCGVSHAILSRFMREERTMTLPMAARLCEEFGYELTKKLEEPKPEEPKPEELK